MVNGLWFWMHSKGKLTWYVDQSLIAAGHRFDFQHYFIIFRSYIHFDDGFYLFLSLFHTEVGFGCMKINRRLYLFTVKCKRKHFVFHWFITRVFGSAIFRTSSMHYEMITENNGINSDTMHQKQKHYEMKKSFFLNERRNV